MANYTKPKVRLSRALGVPIAETSKHVNPRKRNRPGIHGFRRGRQSIYGRQLTEKQRVAMYYNVSNKKLRRYVAMATRAKQDTSVALQEILETRLDNVIRRACWTRTIWQARQIVAHGHIQVNGKKVDRPSYRVKPGDVVSVREKSVTFVKDCAQTSEGPNPPEWLSVEDEKLVATVQRQPVPEDLRMPFEPEYNLIIEFYTR